MTQSPAVRTPGRSGPVRIGERAARTLVAELARINDPKAALLVGAAPESAVLAAAIEALLPGDTLTLVPAGTADSAGLREHVTAQGRWVAERVRVVDTLAEAEPAAVVVAGEAFVGTADEARTSIESLTKYLADGGVLSVATAPGRTAGATAELDRQSALYGVGTDLVLRNNPPVRVHRLRFTPADVAAAERLAPAYRPSSVPLTRTMHIDSNGVAAAGITLGLAALARVARPKSKLWLLPALAAAPVAAFFRDPERDVPEDPSAVVASADGQVLSVQRLHDERFGDGEWLRVAVFLSVLDVHVNRSPVAGKVVDYFVADGGFVNAMKPDAEHNVAAYTVLDTTRGTVVVAQRTGLIARRIVQRAPVGTLLARGERFGLIRFGSRTDVYLPAEAAEPLVGPGDKVVGGSTVIARWR
ncbi:phosphatidylserine decarboxylase [Micromonospora sp. C28SCA-DRY-2]|uniref:phosphatidylserine decarboxylase n=1 Tax=Micromonospora sp. C28SCA-DRY-2 TaxID=3059522 RepID=UPI00267690AA|nr:phosphatidylserine decarboxylase [Micromonospora sp. C28SCA-DRY-2]MDO3702489.1 phosphatidylserine decarboxylase [Micromonospora sp. C28SCA-DRY-2]